MSKIPENERASPQAYVVTHYPNLLHQRDYLAQQAETMTVADLKEKAGEVGIDVEGAGSKAEVVERVRTAARGTENT